ncbi:MAG: hypothetical protein FJ128_04535 [Deltaproteobacteria bacterium]|nr:hypothetical protein [Deltaproteobacteria bacterium]
MHDQAWGLIRATRALIAYIEENQVFDKLADCGCGLYDQYRSDRFDEAINHARVAAQTLEEELDRG